MGAALPRDIFYFPKTVFDAFKKAHPKSNGNSGAANMAVSAGQCTSCGQFGSMMASSSDEIATAQSGNKSNPLHQAVHPYFEEFEASQTGIAVSGFAGILVLFAKPLPFLGFGFIAKMCRDHMLNLHEIKTFDQTHTNTNTELKKQNWRNFRFKSMFLFGGLGATTLGCISSTAYCVAVGSALAGGATIGAALAVTLPQIIVAMGIIGVCCSMLMFGASICMQINRWHVNSKALKNLSSQQLANKTTNASQEKKAENEICISVSKKEIWDSKKGLCATAGMLLATIGVMATPISLIGVAVFLPLYVIHNNKAQSWCTFIKTNENINYECYQNLEKNFRNKRPNFYFQCGLPKWRLIRYLSHIDSTDRPNLKIIKRINEQLMFGRYSTIKNKLIEKSALNVDFA